MKKLKTRFETVPVAEVLKKIAETKVERPVEKLGKKDEPYAVQVSTVKSACRTVAR